MMLMVPAMADDPKRAEPPPRINLYPLNHVGRNLFQAYTPDRALKMGRESMSICV